MGVKKRDIQVINQTIATHPVGNNVDLEVFPTKHGEDLASVGFVMDLTLDKGLTRRIGYTSDTKYFPDLRRQHLTNCDVIIAHFSSAYLDDWGDGKEHKRHLGYTGLLKLIKFTNAKLYVISEFWGGRGDYRIELVQKLKHEIEKIKSRKDFKVLPGSVGCLINLRDLKIRCSRCGKGESYEKIYVTSPEVPFGKLRYLCKNCLLG
ncbi:hypothetical protein ES703_07362 [subsurface metagenome]